MNLPNMDWKQIESLSTCTPIDHPEYILPFGQTFGNKFIADSNRFHCLNRGDTNPFSITNSGSNGDEDKSKTWTQWVNEPCDYTSYRRCLGSTPDICVSSSSKY